MKISGPWVSRLASARALYECIHFTRFEGGPTEGAVRSLI
jgi:hypothetical protein